MAAALPILKVVLAGDGGVGKTSLIRRFCEGRFNTSRVMTIGVDFQTKIVDLPGGRVKLSIWDVAGQDRFQSFRAGFYRGSRAIALVYDLANEVSLKHLADWRREIGAVREGARFLVVGNKADLPRAIPAEKVAQFAESLSAPYLETSAATGAGVPQMFEALARLAVLVPPE